MSDEFPLPISRQTVSRRSLAKGMAWATPVVAMGATAPLFATTGKPLKKPGLNGWMEISHPDGPDYVACTGVLEYTWNSHVLDREGSGRRAVGTDGAPYGLYLYDVEESTNFINAQITIWISGQSPEVEVTMHSAPGSHNWASPKQGTPKQRQTPEGDLRWATPFTFDYLGTIHAADYKDHGDADGERRLYLGDLSFTMLITQDDQDCVLCSLQYSTQRSIMADTGDGEGWQFLGFERKNTTHFNCGEAEDPEPEPEPEPKPGSGKEPLTKPTKKATKKPSKSKNSAHRKKTARPKQSKRHCQ